MANLDKDLVLQWILTCVPLGLESTLPHFKLLKPVARNPFPNRNLTLAFPPTEAGWKRRTLCSLGITRIHIVCYISTGCQCRIFITCLWTKCSLLICLYMTLLILALTLPSFFPPRAQITCPSSSGLCQQSQMIFPSLLAMLAEQSSRARRPPPAEAEERECEVLPQFKQLL